MECEQCSEEHDGIYGSGRFCKEGCSRSYARNTDSGGTKIGSCIKCNKDVEVDKRTSIDKIWCEKCRDVRIKERNKNRVQVPYKKDNKDLYKNFHSKQKGILAETAVKLDLFKQGYFVATLDDDLLPFDLIAIDKDYKTYKVQVKYCPLKRNGGITLDLRNSMSNKNLKYSKYYSEYEVDVFAIYVPDIDECFYIKFEETKNNRSIAFRYKKSNIKSSRMLEDYINFEGS